MEKGAPTDREARKKRESQYLIEREGGACMTGAKKGQRTLRDLGVNEQRPVSVTRLTGPFVPGV